MIDYKTKTDAELVALTLNDQEVFLHLVNRYEAKLLRYIRRITGLSMECAEDILQEAFIKIYRNLNDFDKDLSFSSWVYRITHNEAVNHLKKANNQKTVSLETDDKDALSLIDVLQAETNIPKELDKKEMQKKVRKIVSMLSPDFREILILRYLEEKDYKEISDILKKPMGTVATLVNRAKAQFKQIAEKNNLIYLPS
jgi:RNA polymerase sigma-70 factor, ECF subfamily